MSVTLGLKNSGHVVSVWKHSSSNATKWGEPKSKTTSVHIDDLPNELLIQIFEEYAEFDEPPWCLAVVSDRWRIVALTIPHLWTHITLCNMKTMDTEGVTRWEVIGQRHAAYTKGRKQICGNESDIREALVRAGNQLVTINYHWKRENAGKKSGIFLWKFLLQQSIASRVEALSIEEFRGSLHSLTCDLSPGRFPHLRSLALHGDYKGWAEFLLRNIRQAMPLLEVLELQGPMQLMPDLPVLKKIRLLRAESRCIYSSDLRKLLPSCPNLVEFSDHGPGWQMNVDDNPIEPTNVTPFSRSLHHLSVIGHPSLRVLNFTDTAPLTRRDISFLQIYSLNLRILDFRRIRNLYMPSLVDLTLRTFPTSQFPTNPSAFFSSLIFPSVISFTMESQCEEGVFIAMLKSLPSLEKTHLIQTGYHHPFNLRIPKIFAKTDTQAFCQRIHTITLGSNTSPLRLDRMAMSRQIKDIQKLRMEAGMANPLFILYCHVHSFNAVEKIRHFAI